MDESTILKIAKYKCQLAELDRQYWFENLDENYFKINFDRITEEIRRLEE
tara:strand:- start:357 stop:506 length:150 start_codon:yes stop_codon:yes gene_type:complete